MVKCSNSFIDLVCASNILLTSIKQPFMYIMYVLFLFMLVLSLFMVVFKPGEPFTQEEMDEMLTALADHEKNIIYYRDLLSQLTIDTGM